MTRTTIDYSKITNPAVKKAQALKDIEFYIGKKKFKDQTKLVKACKPKMTFKQFVMMCSIGGIEGYPVFAWAEECGIEIRPDEKANQEQQSGS